MNGPKLLLAAIGAGALFGMLLAVLTNQGTFTPTAAKPHPPRRETRWTSIPAATSSTPTSPTPPKYDPVSGNTATPTPTTPHPKDPTTTAPSTSTTQTATTGTSTPDPTTTTSNPTTTTTEGGLMPSTTTNPTPDGPSITADMPLLPHEGVSDGGKVETRAALGSPHHEGLEPQELVTRLFGPEPDKLPGYWAGQRHYYPHPSA